MAKKLNWEQHDGASYAWALGLHYYSEKTEDSAWPVACMVNGNDLWDGGAYMTRYEAEFAMQKHFDMQIEEYSA